MSDWRPLRDRLWGISQPDFNRLDRVLRRSNGEHDLPFFELAVDQEIIAALLEAPVASLVEKLDFYMGMGYDYVPCKPKVTWPEYRARRAIDSATHARADGREWLEERLGPIQTLDDLASYAFPALSDVDFGDFSFLAGRLPGGAMLVGAYSGVFENAIKLMGMTHLMECSLTQPDLVEAVIARVGEFLLPLYRYISNVPAVGAVLIGDDMGFNTQTLVSPDLLISHVLPWHRRIVEAIHAAGKCVILHSCGQIRPVMKHLIDFVKIDAAHSYQDAVMPVAEAMREYGGRIAVLGGVDVDVLSRHSTAQVRQYVREVLQSCGAGHYALGSGNTVANYVSIENYLVMIEEGARYRGDLD
jgi:uroporphyrinogen decarboxylase